MCLISCKLLAEIMENTQIKLLIFEGNIFTNGIHSNNIEKIGIKNINLSKKINI